MRRMESTPLKVLEQEQVLLIWMGSLNTETTIKATMAGACRSSSPSEYTLYH